MTLADKKSVYEACSATLQSKIALAKESIQMLQASANEETKSSAGDKYETGRAMAQLEIEKLSTQLAELLKQKQLLDQIAIEKISNRVQIGSLVQTSQAIFFIAISVGKLNVGDQDVFCISANSPIGAKLLGLSAGDVFTFYNQTQKVSAVV